jgi:hypothetical protein
MKYLLLLIPTISFANFITEGGSTTYWEQAVCEEKEKAPCYALPPDAETKTLKEVLVNDLEKPIIQESLPIVSPVLDEAGEPVLDDDGLPVNEIKCESGDLIEDKCILITGYEKKLEKQFVLDPVKLKAIEDKKKVLDERALNCEQFKELLQDSAINDKSKAEDVQEVVRRLLGHWKACQ